MVPSNSLGYRKIKSISLPISLQFLLIFLLLPSYYTFSLTLPTSQPNSSRDHDHFYNLLFGVGRCRPSETTCQKSSGVKYCCGDDNYHTCCTQDDGCCPSMHKCCGKYCCRSGDECRRDGCYRTTKTTKTYFIPIGLICAGIGVLARCVWATGDKPTGASPGQELNQNREDGDMAMT